MNARTEIRKGADDTGNRARVLRPAVDIYENGDAITLLANLPGVPEDGLSVEIDGKTLTIQGDIDLDTPADMKSQHADVRSNRYRRAFELSNELDSENISASLNNGLLSVTLPKREAVKPRKIDISVG